MRASALLFPTLLTAAALLLPSARMTAAPAPAPPDTTGLRQRLEPIAQGHAGGVGISVRNLATGESVSIRGDEPFPSASLIKVAILVTLLDEVGEGRMALDEQVTLTARDRVGGSGVLRHMASGLAPTIEDHAWLMITLSDNTATNLLLDRLDIASVGVKTRPPRPSPFAS